MDNNLRQLTHNFIDKYYDEIQPDILDGKPIEFLSHEIEEEIDQLEFTDEGHNTEEMFKVLTDKVMHHRNKPEHPRNFTFIPGPAREESKLAALVTDYYNPNAASHYIASGAVYVEQKLIQFLCEQAGFPKSASGIFVSGGSGANMGAAIAARDSRVNLDEITSATVYISDQAHYSVNKGLQIVGIPDHRIRRVETDDAFRIIPEKLDEMIQEDINNGFKPFMVIATAGTTNAGVIDPLSEIGDIAQKYNLWFHVDGAFGASVLLSKTHRHLLEGVSKADSLTWDGHKWLFQTYSCAMLLVKDRRHLLNSFCHTPEYLADAQMDEQINPWDLSFELSHPARGVKLWFTLMTLGTQKISDLIDRGFENGEWVQDIVKSKPYYEIITPAQLGVINFRYYDSTKTLEELNRINSDLSEKMNESGYAHIVTTQLDGKIVLRIVALSPETRKDEIEKVMQMFDEWIQEIN